MKLYYYPRCSTCVKAKRWLDENNISFECRDLVLDKLNKSELEEIFKLSKLPIKKLFNTSGLVYKEKNIKEVLPTLDLDGALELLSSDGKLVKRPILHFDDKVLVGFNEEEWRGAIVE